jgi:UDP-N-acetylglucosamine:LPS N-acetylglucosamine transferase
MSDDPSSPAAPASASSSASSEVRPGSQVLLVTSAGAPPHAVVPVLAAAEAHGLRVRAIDLGGAGAGGNALTDRVRRALLGEGAERRLRKELELNPPDVAVVFDPHSAQALTVARDEVLNPAPVVAVVAELEPAAAWAQTDADRFLALDEIAAVTLAEHGVEADRILVVGAFGEHAFWQAGRRDRAAVRERFKLTGAVVLVEVAGMGAELTNQLSLQLSLLDAHERTTFLFDAAGDAEAAAVLRRSVPALGLRAKLFGVTTDASELWRAADVVIGRPTPQTTARAMLLGARLVALIDDSSPGLAATAAALELRKLATAARGLLLLTSALEAAMRQPARMGEGSGDAAATCADVLSVLAADKRAVIDERRAVGAAATRERIRAASAAAGAATKVASMPGDLEDLSGGGAAEAASAAASVPDIDVAALQEEGRRRLSELSKAMMAAQRAADAATAEAAAQRGRGEDTAAAAAQRRGDAERARMHSLLAEMSTLQHELKELDRVAAAQPRPSRSSGPSSAGSAGSGGGRSGASVDDLLADLKSKAGATTGEAPRPSASSSGSSSSGPGSGGGRPKAKAADDVLNDELAALKQKMAQMPPKKKP